MKSEILKYDYWILKKGIEKIVPKGLLNKGIKKSVLKFDPGLVLIGL